VALPCHGWAVGKPDARRLASRMAAHSASACFSAHHFYGCTQIGLQISFGAHPRQKAAQSMRPRGKRVLGGGYTTHFRPPATVLILWHSEIRPAK
jgi:hypothetical protein